MAEIDLFTFASRRATFDEPVQLTKRRSSNAKRKQSTTVSWPHAKPNLDQLARAGFYYKPTATNPDSVTCFLCQKSLDGWDPEDIPAVEHLAHVSDCPWAICCGVELRSQDPESMEEDPRSEKMNEARKATFVDRWPHEGKKGWKCKTVKMVDAGWSYEPLPEADDCVKCFYCGVCLDGWEPKDDPWDEHQRRSPECYFFASLTANKKNEHAKPVVKRAPRSSRVSRVPARSGTSMSPGTLAQALCKTGDEDEDNTLLSTASAKPKASRARKIANTLPVAGSSAMQGQLLIDSQGDHEGNTIISTAGTKRNAPKSNKRTSKLLAGHDSARRPSRQAYPVAQALEQADLDGAATHVVEVQVEPIQSHANQGIITQWRDQIQATVNLTSPSAVESPEISKKMDRRRPAREQSRGQLDQTRLRPEPQAHSLQATTQIPAKVVRRHLQNLDSSIAMNSPSIILLNSYTETLAPRATRSKKRMSDGTHKDEISIVAIPGTSHEEGAVEITPVEGSEIHRDIHDTSITSIVPNHDVLPTSAPLRKGQISTEKPSAGIQIKFNGSSAIPSASTLASKTPMSNQIKNVPSRSATSSAAKGLSGRVAIASQSAGGDTEVATQFSDTENVPPNDDKVPSKPEEGGMLSKMVWPTSITTNQLTSPTPEEAQTTTVQSSRLWEEIDLENVFVATIAAGGVAANDTTLEQVLHDLSQVERQMNVENWILWNAKAAEEKLKGECEELIHVFEREGVRALNAMSGIECG